MVVVFSLEKESREWNYDNSTNKNGIFYV